MATRNRGRKSYRSRQTSTSPPVPPVEEEHIADKFAEIEEETRRWLDRMNTEERANHIWVGRRSEVFRKRSEQLMGLPDDRWIALFSVSLTWSNMVWALKTGFYIITSVAATLLAYNSIWPYIRGLVGG